MKRVYPTDDGLDNLRWMFETWPGRVTFAVFVLITATAAFLSAPYWVLVVISVGVGPAFIGECRRRLGSSKQRRSNG